MKNKNMIFIASGLLSISHLCYAELLWSPKPKTPPITHKIHQTNHRIKEKIFYLNDNTHAHVKFITPSLNIKIVNAQKDSNKYILPKTGMDNYHALLAERKTDNTYESSLRYVSMRDKPSGYSPRKLIKKNKLPLEIVPEPMIREHWHFYTSNNHNYKVLFKGKPLADTWVTLNTSNGSNLDAKTDIDGMVSFILPEDFKNIQPGRRANQPEEFILRTVHISHGITYKTNFSAPYSVNPSHWNSNIGGILSLSIGFLSGIIIMRKHNRASRRAS